MNYHEKLSTLKEESIENVIIQSYRLFLEKGVDKTTMTDIAKEAEISPTTLFRYFGSKKTLLIECGQHFWEKRMILNNASLSPDFEYMTGYLQTKALLHNFLYALLEYPEHLRFLRDFELYMERHHASIESFQPYDEAINDWYKIAQKSYDKGINDHTLKSNIDFKAYYFTTTHLLLSLAQKLACEAILLPSDSKLSAESQMETAIEMILSYMRS